MRYPEAHAARSGSVPFMARGPKSLRTAVAVVAAGVIGLVPALVCATPASAAAGDLVITPTVGSVVEGGTLSFSIAEKGGGSTGTFNVATVVDDTFGASKANLANDLGTPSPATIDATAGNGPWVVTVPTTQDTTYETSETFKLRITLSGDSVTTVAEVVATIQADGDPPPTYSLTATSPTVAESASVLTTSVTAELSKASDVPVSVDLVTENGTATGGSDFTALATTNVIIAAGAMTSSATVVTVLNDIVKDSADTETFKVNGVATGTLNPAASTTISITDDETTPKLNLSRTGTQQEGNAVTYTVTATPGSELPISFQWNAVAASPVDATHGLATPGTDFPYPAADARRVTIVGTTATIPLNLFADNLNEKSPEDYAIEIASLTNAEAGTITTMNGVIADAGTDTAPSVNITGTPVTEGNSGTLTKTFTATLTKASGRTVTIDWETGDHTPGLGYAVAGKDYKAAEGRLVFEPGVLTKTFTVDVLGDVVDEDTGESFDVELHNVDETAAGLGTNASPVVQVTPVMITDDDDKPSLMFEDTTVDEADVVWAALLPVKLVGTTSDRPITFTMGAANTTGDYLSTIVGAPGTEDYALAGTTVVIPAEQSTGYGVVVVKGDKVYESNESTHVTITASTNGEFITGSPKTAKFTLNNDDDAPNLEINSVTGDEGETVNVTGTVDGVAEDDVTVNVTFAGKTVDGIRAASPSDFVNPGAKAIKIEGGTDSGTSLSVATIELLKTDEAEPAEAIVASGFGLNNIGTVTDGVIKINEHGEQPGEPGDSPKPTILGASRVYGPSKVELSGMVAPNKQVELWGAPVGGGLLKWIKNVDSDDEGHYDFEHSITWGHRFLVESQDMKSDEKVVWVVQKPIFVVSTSTKGAIHFGVKGYPWAVGQTVAVQRWTNSGWATIRAGKTGGDAVWRGSIPFASGSKIVLRAWVSGESGRGTLPAFSPQQTTTVR
ncbi:Calx-beta domain-containing protein [Actinoplanes solisilvae]|uniref:Calx-beta domain-containing protein n=1 Tax=Actinoplanes solisilvae TaxID=2486853 RepID=UPI000FDA52E1|nr:Calx-beta domain-containing protein [Actinoplanes solisilvae]